MKISVNLIKLNQTNNFNRFDSIEIKLLHTSNCILDFYGIKNPMHVIQLPFAPVALAAGSLLSNNFNVDRYVGKDQTRRAFGWLTRSRHVDGSIRNKVYKNEAANAQKITNPEIKRERDRQRHTHTQVAGRRWSRRRR